MSMAFLDYDTGDSINSFKVKNTDKVFIDSYRIKVEETAFFEKFVYLNCFGGTLLSLNLYTSFVGDFKFTFFTRDKKYNLILPINKGSSHNFSVLPYDKTSKYTIMSFAITPKKECQGGQFDFSFRANIKDLTEDELSLIKKDYLLYKENML